MTPGRRSDPSQLPIASPVRLSNVNNRRRQPYLQPWPVLPLPAQSRALPRYCWRRDRSPRAARCNETVPLSVPRKPRASVRADIEAGMNMNGLPAPMTAPTIAIFPCFMQHVPLLLCQYRFMTIAECTISIAGYNARTEFERLGNVNGLSLLGLATCRGQVAIGCVARLRAACPEITAVGMHGVPSAAPALRRSTQLPVNNATLASVY